MVYYSDSNKHHLLHNNVEEKIKKNCCLWNKYLYICIFAPHLMKRLSTLREGLNAILSYLDCLFTPYYADYLSLLNWVSLFMYCLCKFFIPRNIIECKNVFNHWSWLQFVHGAFSRNIQINTYINKYALWIRSWLFENWNMKYVQRPASNVELL